MIDFLGEFVSFLCGMALILITWFVSLNDDRRQYRIGYRDGFNDGRIEGFNDGLREGARSAEE